MKINIHVTHHLDPVIERLLDRLSCALLTQGEKIMALLDQLTADVQADKDAVNSAITLINGLAQQIKDAGTDPAALKALTDQLEANTSSLAAAVTANTTPPAEPTV